jgi:hypothetical protein
MVDEDAVYEKTAMGMAEAGSHHLGVSPKLRRALSLVDGVRTVAQIAPMLRAGEADEILEQLEEEGLIALRTGRRA